MLIGFTLLILATYLSSKLTPESGIEIHLAIWVTSLTGLTLAVGGQIKRAFQMSRLRQESERICSRLKEGENACEAALEAARARKSAI